MTNLQDQINELWNRSDELSPGDTDAVAVIRSAIDLLDRGEVRVAEVGADDSVTVHEWLKQAILLLFRTSAMETTELGPFEFADKIPLKTNYQSQGVRVLPGASARWGSYLAPGVVLIPSETNIGAYFDTKIMVDT